MGEVEYLYLYHAGRGRGAERMDQYGRIPGCLKWPVQHPRTKLVFPALVSSADSVLQKTDDSTKDYYLRSELEPWAEA